MTTGNLHYPETFLLNLTIATMTSHDSRAIPVPLSNQRGVTIGASSNPRRSFSSRSFFRRSSRTGGSGSWRNIVDAEVENSMTAQVQERPAIPSALAPSTGEAVSTPLPVLPMVVLSIVSSVYLGD